MESVKVKCGAENRGIVQNSIHETIKPLQVDFQVSIPYPSGGKQEVSSLESAHVFPPPHPTLPKIPKYSTSSQPLQQHTLRHGLRSVTC